MLDGEELDLMRPSGRKKLDVECLHISVSSQFIHYNYTGYDTTMPAMLQAKVIFTCFLPFSKVKYLERLLEVRYILLFLSLSLPAVSPVETLV